MSKTVTIKIREPMWQGGPDKQKVGVADYRLKGFDLVRVTCEWEDAHGDKPRPHTYQMSVAKAKKYPTQKVRGNVKLYIIPIDDFEIYKGEI